MIDVERIKAIMKAHDLNNSSLARLLNVTPSKVSKVVTGDQFLSAESVGQLIKEFNIHPNWIFGYEGEPNKVMYLEDLVPKKELEEQEKKLMELERENANLYRKLATHLEQQVAETKEKYNATQKKVEALKNS